MNYFKIKSKLINTLSITMLACVVCFFSQCMPEETDKIKNDDANNNTNNTDSTLANNKLPKLSAFYETELTDTSALVIADTITYFVVIKNPDSEDAWTEECLKNVDIKTLVDKVYKAVYDGKVKAYNLNDEILTIEDVLAMEKEEGKQRNMIGRVEFVEEWYFDEENFKMGKKVNFLMFGYENYDSEGEVKNYKAGIKVKLN